MTTAIIWLSAAFGLGFLVRMINLPPLVGYLAAGFLLSYNGYENNAILDNVAHAGVLLLLFSIGLKLRLKSLLRAEILAGSLLHMLLSMLVFIGLIMQFTSMTPMSAALVALALSFSSTVVAAKVLESRRELRAFHGRVAIGILIMQDLVAVAVLSMAGGTSPSPWAFLLIGILVLRPIMHKLLDLSGHGELIILYGLMLALVAGGESFHLLGLSSELGALLFGIIIADHPRAKEVSDALWGLKEILLVGFFLQIGLYGHPTLEHLGQALALNALLPLKALLFFFILVLFRLRARTAFLAGLNLATYSEFGLIVANMGVRNGLLSQEWVVILAVTVALSFAISAPLNRYAHLLQALVGRFLERFESSKRHPDDEPIKTGHSQIIIMGMGRVGSSAYELLSQEHHRVLGLDSDPGKVEKHLKMGHRVLYADAEDPSFWSKLDLEGVRMILLAIPEVDAKVTASRQLRARGFKGLISATALFHEELEPLKASGADIVYDYYEGIGGSFARLTLEHLKNSD